jgi:hypothetical protein
MDGRRFHIRQVTSFSPSWKMIGLSNPPKDSPAVGSIGQGESHNLFFRVVPPNAAEKTEDDAAKFQGNFITNFFNSPEMQVDVKETPFVEFLKREKYHLEEKKEKKKLPNQTELRSSFLLFLVAHFFLSYLLMLFFFCIGKVRTTRTDWTSLCFGRPKRNWRELH